VKVCEGAASRELYTFFFFFLLQEKCSAKPMQGYPPLPVPIGEIDCALCMKDEVEEINWGDFGIASFLFQT